MMSRIFDTLLERFSFTMSRFYAPLLQTCLLCKRDVIYDRTTPPQNLLRHHRIRKMILQDCLQMFEAKVS